LLPFQMFLLPLYIGSSAVGLYDTRLGFTIIYLGICIPFALFLYRNYASKVPPALIDAARVDGCTDLMVFRHVFLPITKPAFLSVFVIQFIWGWNNLLFGMVLTEDARPVMAAVAKLSPSRGYTPVPVILAGSLLASIPTILVFLFLHQYFVEGLAIRANK
ncbi:MAG: carbohydrate ABC transporter permease, partial [Bacillota bacterium]